MLSFSVETLLVTEMAKLVDVFDPDAGYDFQRRQVPLKVEDLNVSID